MAKLISWLFLTLVLSYTSHEVSAKAKFKGSRVDIDEKLKQLNKPAVKTIKSENGEIIDCVDIYKQPAFDNPALKNHVIQMKPSFDFREEKPRTKNNPSKLLMSQTWQKYGSCPEGTVPIRRIRRKDLLRAKSIARFGRKSQATPEDVGWMDNRSVATLYTNGSNYIGARGHIGIWTPNVEAIGEYTTAQIWVQSGPESIEAGWMVNPELYGDNSTRLFGSWTKDSHDKTGCFDLTCGLFVQISRDLALGAFFSPVSTVFGDQYHIALGLFMDPNTKNWWLKYGDIREQNEVVVGYWPTTGQFEHLSDSATVVEWGGQVYSTTVKSCNHTTTGMGSGQFSSGLNYVACSIYEIMIIDKNSLALKYPDNVNIWVDEPYCYTAQNHQEPGADSPSFYFGGPGKNVNCP